MDRPTYKFELPCPVVKQDCKYQPECPLMSVHHIVPRRIGSVAISEAIEAGNDKRARLIRSFISHWSNKALVGRCLHDTLDNFPEPLPPDDEMLKRVHS